ncbi:hypothetical protein ACFYZN_11635 [Streptomyces sp. NPDC001777]|uniref:hypothetical protein n=1 Tax=Streptomyces sp. NPDC001777 TaxID=3364608 RepID=UPI00368234FC
MPGRISPLLEEKLDALAQAMAEHMARPFPSGFRGLDGRGQDMVLLDADIYGYAAVVAYVVRGTAPPAGSAARRKEVPPGD